MGPALQIFHFINHMMCCRHVISYAWNSLPFSALPYNTCQHLEIRALHSDNIHWRRLASAVGKSISCSAGLAGRKRSVREQEKGNGAVMKREEKQFQYSTDYFLFFKEVLLLLLLLYCVVIRPVSCYNPRGTE